MSVEERELKNKFMTYEKNLEQLTLMYHSLASQKNLLTKDAAIFEKKLKRKAEKIIEMDK